MKRWKKRDMMSRNPWDKIDIANSNQMLNGFLADKNASIEFYWQKIFWEIFYL